MSTTKGYDCSVEPWVKEVGAILDREKAALSCGGNFPIALASWLYVTDHTAMWRCAAIRDLNITHVISTNEMDNKECEQLKRRLVEEMDVRHHLFVYGQDTQNYDMIGKNWGDCRNFLRQAKTSSSSRVIVLCDTGVNLSRLIAAAALMYFERKSLLDTVETLKQRSGDQNVLTNKSFQLQLCEFAKAEGLFGGRSGLSTASVQQATGTSSRSSANEASNDGFQERSLPSTDVILETEAKQPTPEAGNENRAQSPEANKIKELVVSQIETKGGRFLRREGQGSDCVWALMSHKEALKLVTRAFWKTRKDRETGHYGNEVQSITTYNDSLTRTSTDTTQIHSSKSVDSKKRARTDKSPLSDLTFTIVFNTLNINLSGEGPRRVISEYSDDYFGVKEFMAYFCKNPDKTLSDYRFTKDVHQKRLRGFSVWFSTVYEADQKAQFDRQIWMDFYTEWIKNWSQSLADKKTAQGTLPTEDETWVRPFHPL